MPLAPQPGFIPTILADSIQVYIGTGATGRARASNTTLDMVEFVKLDGQSMASIFTPADVGMPIAIIGGGAIDAQMPNYFVRGAMFHTTIASYVSPTEVILTDAPVTSIFNTGFVTIVCYRPVDFQMDSFTYQSSIAPGTRDTAAFTVLYDSEYIARFEVVVRGQPVYIRSTDPDANLEFGGSINTLDVSNQPGTDLGAQPIFSWAAGCTNWASIAFRRVVSPVNGAELSADGDVVFKQLVLVNLIDEGVSCSTETAIAVNLGQTVGSYINTLLDQLVQQISTPSEQWYWDVDPWRKFILAKRETVAAPWNVTDGYDIFAGDQPVPITNSYTGDQLANFVYGIAAAVLDGDVIVTLNGTDSGATSFALPQPVQSLPVVTLNSASQTVGVQGVDVGFDWYYSQGSPQLTQDPKGTVLTPTDILMVTYTGSRPGVAVAPNVGSLQKRSNVECTSGQYDYSFSLDQPIQPGDLLNLCIAYEQTYGVQPQIVQLSTLKPGLAVGQLQHIDYPAAGVPAGDYQIATVKITTANQVIRWGYTAFMGANTGGGITGLVQFVNRATGNSSLTTPVQIIQEAYTEITIDHARVSGGADLINFVFCFRGTYSFLAAIGDGGKVANLDGSDIFFSSDSAGQDLLQFDLSFYDHTTGAIVAWVLIPTLSHTLDTLVYINYGDPSIIVSRADPAATWSPNVEHLSVPNDNFRAVYHFDDAAAPYLDATQYNKDASDGTPMNPPVRIAGLFGYAQNFGGLTQIDAPQSLDGNGFGNAEFTVSCWFLNSALPTGADQVVILDEDGIMHAGLRIEILASNGHAAGGTSDSGLLSSFVNVCDGNWHYIVLSSFPGGMTKLYVDGVLYVVGTGLSTHIGGTYGINIAGPDSFHGFDALQGALDEVHFTQVQLSDGWIATEYANQHDPGTFYSFGLQPAPPTHVIGNPQGTVTNTLGVLTDDLPVLGNGGNDIKLGVAGQLVPAGGSTGQVLAKTSGTDYATEWETVTESAVFVNASPTLNIVKVNSTAAWSGQTNFEVNGVPT